MPTTKPTMFGALVTREVIRLPRVSGRCSRLMRSFMDPTPVMSANHRQL